jgi:hypothetical protein
MRTGKVLGVVAAMCVVMLWWASVGEAALGTAFTYQGRLMDSNDVANGKYDFQFRMFDDPDTVVGIQIGPDVVVDDVNVADGYFTVDLDFGGGAFDGNARWLEIGVRPGAQSDPDPYSILAPAQKISPAPYAMYAETCGSGGGGVPVPLELSGSVSSPGAIIKGTITSGTGYGVMGQYKYSAGKWGYLGSSTYAVAGRDDVSGNYGYIGSSSEGVFGYSLSGWAGLFQGKAKVEGDLYVNGRYYDSSSDAGTSGQVLSSTGSGTNWITPEVSVPLSLSGSVSGPGAVISATNTSWDIDAHGIHGAGIEGNGVDGYSDGGYGVYGDTYIGYGVYGECTFNAGVFGRSRITGNSGSLGGSAGARGHSTDGTGVWGESDTGNGVHGESTSGDGVYGESDYGYGVYGYSWHSWGVYGRSLQSYAGYFDGDLHVEGNIEYTGSCTDVSDIRLKENIAPLENGIEKISSLKGIYFNNKGESVNNREVGVIAQDVEKVLPELVSTNKDGYKSVDYTKLSAVLIEAVKEQQKQIEAMQAEIERLKNQIK